MSNAQWNIKALREHVRNKGHDIYDPLPQALRSVDRTIQIFHYHAYEARDALKGFVEEGEQPTKAHLKLIFGISEQQEQFALARLASEAHLLGALLATRNIYDIFSQAVNALLLGSKLSIKECDIHKVRQQLPAGALRQALDDLVTSNWFRYVQGFVNLSKHRHLMEHGLRVSFANNAAGVQVGAFTYGQDSYPAKSAVEVLKGAFEVKNRIVACGRELNVACGVPA
jgi:hypothetical protein